ncbi:MAG: NAD-dependent epimerase/dehydratase family protein [Myxococcales bacterium]|nr:NAD-dependent epimerase/dehydratase family protein [Myxococcales bacterium]
MSAKTVLVTGASGFLGLHLVSVLHKQGHTLRSLSRSASPRLEPFEVDQRRGSVVDLEDCRDAVRGVDAVYHCAGFVSRESSRRGEMFDVHVSGTRNILRACKEAGIEDVLVVSTSGTVGVSKRPDFLGREDSPVPTALLRDWPYYESKVYAEKEVMDFVAQGFPVKLARPTLVLGPGDHTSSSTGDVVKFLCGDVKASLPGGVSAVDVRDVAAVLPSLMEVGTPGLGYLLTGTNLPLRDFLILLSELSGVRAPALELPRKLLSENVWLRDLLGHASQLKFMGGLDKQTFDMACHYWYVDSSRAVTELGFAPRPLAETLADTIEDLRAGLPAFG